MISPPPSDIRDWGFGWIEWLSRLWHWLRFAVHTGQVTLASDTSTTVSDPACFSTSKVFLMPTQTGSGFGGTNNIYVSSITTGQFVLNHAVGAGGLVFDYLIVNE